MSEDVLGEFDPELEEFGPKKKFNGKRMVLFILLPLLLGGAGAFFGVFSSGKDAPPAEKKAVEEDAPRTVFFDLPEILVNLNSTSRRPSFLKIKVSLELENSSDVARMNVLKPRIIDNFQVYLRELRIDDLRGSAGVYRLREELLARVNMAVQPTQVKNVLFKEILIQ